MTRVEKYRRYREEIANMKVDNFSSKKEAGDKLGDNTDSSVVNYEQVMGIHEMYDKNDSPCAKRKHHLQVNQIRYLLITTVTLLAILIAIILVGMNLWSK